MSYQMLSLISLIVNDACQKEIDCQILKKQVGLDTVYDKLNIYVVALIYS